MFVVASCSRCSWTREVALTEDALVDATVALDEHLLTAHDVTFSTAADETKRWLADVSRKLSDPKRETR